MMKAIAKLSAWKAPNPIPKQMRIFLGSEILFHQDRVLIAAVPQDAQ